MKRDPAKAVLEEALRLLAWAEDEPQHWFNANAKVFLQEVRKYRDTLS